MKRNTAHSKGPWKSRAGFSDGTVEIYSPDPSVKLPFRPNALAEVEADTPEGKANARLIKAAPRLLDAVEAAIRATDNPTLLDVLRDARDAAVGKRKARHD